MGDTTLFGSSLHQTSDGQRLVGVGFVQSTGQSYAGIWVKNATGHFVEYGLMEGDFSSSVTTTPGILLRTTSYLDEDGYVSLWGFFDGALVTPGIIAQYYNNSGTYTFFIQYSDPFVDPSRVWGLTFAVSRNGAVLAVPALSFTPTLRSIEIFYRASGGTPPPYIANYTISGNIAGEDENWASYLTLSSSGKWLAVGSPVTQRYYIYDVTGSGGLVFTSNASSGDTANPWSVVAFNDDENELRLGVSGRPFESSNEIIVRFFNGTWNVSAPIHLNDSGGDAIQCNSMTFCANGRSLLCSGGSNPTGEPLLWLQDAPFSAASTWSANETIVAPVLAANFSTLGATPSSTTGFISDGTEAVIGWSGYNGDGYGGTILYYTGFPACSLPPPVAPVAPPVTPPVVPPVAPTAPTSPPVQPTVPPIFFPILPTTAPAAPVETPTQPAAPSTPIAPSSTIPETTTPTMIQTGTIVSSVIGGFEGIVVIFLIIALVAVLSQ